MDYGENGGSKYLDIDRLEKILYWEVLLLVKVTAGCAVSLSSVLT